MSSWIYFLNLVFLFASSFKVFTAWFDPFLFSYLAHWWPSPDWVFCFVDLLYPASRIHPRKFWGAYKLYKFHDPPGTYVEPLDTWLFLTLSRKSKLYEIENFVFRQPLVHPDGGNLSRCSTTFPTLNTNPWILVSWGLYTPCKVISSSAGAPLMEISGWQHIA